MLHMNTGSTTQITRRCEELADPEIVVSTGMCREVVMLRWWGERGQSLECLWLEMC
jgi:hypothetical protein